MKNLSVLIVWPVLLAGLFVAPHSTLAQTLYWDPSNTGGTGSGGPGTWNTGTPWFNGASDIAWPTGSNAFFAGGAGTVTLSAPETAGNLTFTTTGYTVTGSTLTLSGTPTISIPSGTTTISSILAGSHGLTYSGTGTLVLGGVNTYTGGTTINGGTVQIAAASGIGAANGALTFANGGILHNTAGLTDTGPITLNSGGGQVYAVTLSGAITGGGGLTINAGDSVLSSGATCNIGTLKMTGARLFISSTPVIAGATIVAANVNSYIIFQNSAPISPANTMSFVSGSILTARATISGPLTVNTANVTFPSTGSMIFNQDSTTAGAATTNIIVNGNYPTLTGPLTIQVGAGTATATTATGPLTLNGAINGPFALTKTAPNANSLGNIILNGTNGYTGNTTVSAGGFNIGGSGCLGVTTLVTNYAGNIALTAATSLLTNATSATQTWSGVVSGAGKLAQSGTGTLVLNNTETYTGGTIVTGGVLQLGDGSVLQGALAGVVTVTSPGLLAFANPGSAQTTATVISGTGGITQNGPSEEILSGANAYSGTTTVKAGTLALSGSGSIGTSSLSILAGATFDVSALASPATVTGATLSASGTATPATINGASGGTVNLGSGSQTISLTYDGTDVPLTISFSGGVGTLALNGNTFVVNNASGSPLTIAGSPYALIQIPSGGTVAASGTYAASVTGSGLATGTSAYVTVSGTTVELVVQPPPSDVWDGADFNNNPDWSDGNNWLSTSAPNPAGDNVTFAGTAGLAPVMNNSYSVYSLSFSNTAGAFTLGNSGGAVLSVSGGVTDNSTNGQTIATPVALLGNASPWSIPNTGETLTVSDPVSDTGSGLTLSGSGTLDLTGVNTFTGGIANAAGSTVEVGGAGSLGGGAYAGAITDNGAFLYNSSAAQTLSGPITVGGTFTDNNTAAQTLSGLLTVTGTFTDNSTVAQTLSGPIVDNGTLIFNSSAAQTLPGLISGTGTLTQSGASTLTLGNAGNTYQGGTTINGSSAVVSIAADGDLGTGPLTFANGGTLKNTVLVVDSRAINLTSGSGTAGFILMSGVNFTINGTISGGGGLSVHGADFILQPAGNANIGTFTQTGNRVFVSSAGAFGASPNLATVNVTGGELIFQFGALTSAPSAPANIMSFASGTSLTARATLAGAPLTVNTANVSFPTTGTMVFNNDLDNTATTGIVVNGNYPTLTGSLTIQMAEAGAGTVGSVTLNGAIGDGGLGYSLTKTSPGTNGLLILNGTNTYTGNTTIASGPLTIGASGCLGVTATMTNYAGNIANTGLLTNASSASQTWSGVVSGTGPLNQAGSGTLILSGLNTYTGVTTISAGTLQADSAETAGSSGPLGNQAANAAGSIVMRGGTLQYSSANQNDYSARFSTAASQDYNIDANGQAVTFATALTSSGGELTLTNSTGTGSLMLTAADTYTGGTTVSAGTLVLGSGGSIANTAGVSIGSGGTLDVSAQGPSYTMPGTSFAASGDAPATLIGPVGGTVGLGSLPVTLTYGGANPSLTISQGTLSLNGNAFTVNTFNGAHLPVGTYLLVVPSGSGSISGTVSAAVTGTALWAGTMGSIAIAGGNVVLTITATPTPVINNVSITGTNLTLSGTNGPDNGTYYVLTSTNVSLPLSQWTSIATNTFSPTGTFSVTTAVSLSQSFFVIAIP